MKLNQTQRTLKTIAVFSLCSNLFLTKPALANVKPVNFKTFKLIPAEEKPAKKKKAKAKSSATLNNSAVKIFSDAFKREMHVVAKNNDGKEIDFFVFDLHGTLMQNYKMKAKDHVRISGLNKGTYVYRVFCGDVETISGNFEIR